MLFQQTLKQLITAKEFILKEGEKEVCCGSLSAESTQMIARLIFGPAERKVRHVNEWMFYLILGAAGLGQGLKLKLIQRLYEA